jgi:hypothetical protein
MRTDNEQNYSDISNFPYLFHIKLQFFKSLSWSQFMLDFEKSVYFIVAIFKKGEIISELYTHLC